MHTLFLTKSTVFLLLVSLKVSPTKLSQRPLQSSGSSVDVQAHYQPSDHPNVLTSAISLQTFNQPVNLRVSQPFLQVLNHSVSDSRQVTHVSSSSAPFSPADIDRHQTTRLMWVTVYKPVQENRVSLTGFCHFPPRHPEFSAPADNAGRAGATDSKEKIKKQNKMLMI